MDLFEGYIGIKIGEYQLVKDTVFALLLLLFVAFAIIFNSHFSQFGRMIKNVVQVKQRQSLFEVTLGGAKGNEKLFRFFMIFQALFLCSLFFFYTGLTYDLLPSLSAASILITIGSLFLILSFFFFAKKGILALFGWTFMDEERLKLWNASYLACIELWGVSLYIPVILSFFSAINPLIPSLVFLFLYISCRFVIFYKSIRIFQVKRDGALLFFLYLCAQEIMPLFLLFKGVEFLYNFIELSTLWR